MSRRTRIPIAVLVVSMLMVVVAAGMALAATRYCAGHGNYCYGTANPDTIYDGPGYDVIQARASGDVVRAGWRAHDYDDVYGGRGGDVIHARDDYDSGYSDIVNGQRGYDVCYVDPADLVDNCEEVHRR
jgi:RTX calcium-binding nonapeptide repeat (4 copies)